MGIDVLGMAFQDPFKTLDCTGIIIQLGKCHAEIGLPICGIGDKLQNLLIASCCGCGLIQFHQDIAEVQVDLGVRRGDS